MRDSTLNLLECPFCGGGLSLQPHPVPERNGDEIRTAILACACCAYPVIDGIAYIRTGSTAQSAMKDIGAGRHEDALARVLGFDQDGRERFGAALQNDDTFRGLLRVFAGHDREYLLYRFSDPTYILTEAIATVLARQAGQQNGAILDFAGGAGHLSRVLHRESDGSQVVLADVSFWELWLAKRFVAPDADAVCCDGNSPLPLRKGAFALSFCADAFEYIWARRLLAEELQRATAPNGAVAVCHVNDAAVFNLSAGMPLTAAGYRRLFQSIPMRVYPETALRESVWAGTVDLSVAWSDEQLASEPTYAMVGSHDPTVFREHPIAPYVPAAPDINPLYEATGPADAPRLELKQASDGYELEFGEFRQYLPTTVDLPANWRQRLRARDEQMLDLVRRRVLLDLPERYVSAR